MNFDQLDRDMINALSGDISGSLRPYKDIADSLGMSPSAMSKHLKAMTYLAKH